MPEPIFNTTQVGNNRKSKTAIATKSASSSHQSDDDQAGQYIDPQQNDEGQLNLDVYETPTDLVIIAPIAGVKMTDINVSVTEDILTIKGQRHFDSSITEEDYLIQECFWGSFSRSIVLPSNVDTTKISASFKDGVLKITMPRTEKNKMKLIKIKAE